MIGMFIAIPCTCKDSARPSGDDRVDSAVWEATLDEVELELRVEFWARLHGERGILRCDVFLNELQYKPEEHDTRDR